MAAQAQGFYTRFAFGLALVTCVLGLCVCLVKSPSARSDAYLAYANDALHQNDPQSAAAAALMAVRYDPANARGWTILSGMLQRDGQDIAARQAATIARRLQQNYGSQTPSYAMPAELKLSLLAMGEKGGL